MISTNWKMLVLVRFVVLVYCLLGVVVGRKNSLVDCDGVVRTELENVSFVSDCEMDEGMLIAGRFVYWKHDSIYTMAQDFGESVWEEGNRALAISGDKQTLIVGTATSGKATIFHRKGSNKEPWVESDILTPSEDTGGFGFAVGISWDGTKVVVGAAKGKAYVFHQNTDGSWSEVKLLLDPMGDFFNTNFGSSVDISADGKVVAVGAPLGTGNVYLYGEGANGTGNWGLTKTLQGRSDRFGKFVRFANDLSSTIAVSSYDSQLIYLLGKNQDDWFFQAEIPVHGYISRFLLLHDKLFVGSSRINATGLGLQYSFNGSSWELVNSYSNEEEILKNGDHHFGSCVAFDDSTGLIAWGAPESNGIYLSQTCTTDHPSSTPTQRPRTSPLVAVACFGGAVLVGVPVCIYTHYKMKAEKTESYDGKNLTTTAQRNTKTRKSLRSSSSKVKPDGVFKQRSLTRQ